MAGNMETSREFSKQEGVEFEPTKMIVVQDFTPCVEDELAVKRGEIVKALYQENEWRFVVAKDGCEGFIPYTFCVPMAGSTMKHKKHGDELVSTRGKFSLHCFAVH